MNSFEEEFSKKIEKKIRQKFNNTAKMQIASGKEIYTPL